MPDKLVNLVLELFGKYNEGVGDVNLVTCVDKDHRNVIPFTLHLNKPMSCLAGPTLMSDARAGVVL